MALFTQNSELKPHGIFNWTIPAWYVRRADGSIFKTCPNAGACAKVCYARNGTYRFSNVVSAHTRNLDLVLDDPSTWEEEVCQELRKRKYRPTGSVRELPDGIKLHDLDPWLVEWVQHGGKAVRIHDAGDFFADWYLEAWLRICRENLDILFYAYTKEVSMFRRVKQFPVNFRYLFSTGGLEDHLIGEDRHADVFPTEEAIIAAGYISQDASDLLAVLLPTNKIGIPANNIPAFNKKLAGRRFSEI
jgi:hypothetical protein